MRGAYKSGQRRVVTGSIYKIIIGVVIAVAVALVLTLLAVLPAMDDEIRNDRTIVSIENISDVGTNFSPSQIYVRVTYSDGSTETVSLANTEHAGLDTSVEGNNTVVLSYGGFQQTININVKNVDCQVRYIAGVGGRIQGETEQLVPNGGDAATVIAIPESGYVFSYWNDGYPYATRKDTGIVQSKEIEAVFERAKFTVIFYYHDGTVASEEKVRFGETPAKVPNPNADPKMQVYGYTFSNWIPNDFSVIDRDMVIRPEYVKTATDVIMEVPLDKYGNAMGSVDVNSEGYYAHGETATIIASPYNSREFAYWQIADINGNYVTIPKNTGDSGVTVSVGLGGEELTFVSTKSGVEDYILSFTPNSTIAQLSFRAIFAYSASDITFINYQDSANNNVFMRLPGLPYGKSLSEFKAGDIDLSAGMPTPDEIVGLQFLGWYIMEDETQTIIDETATFEQPTSLVAKWKRIQYTVTFSYTDEVGTEINYHETAITYQDAFASGTNGGLPTVNPTKDKYVFIGWQDALTGQTVDDRTKLYAESAHLADEDFTTRHTMRITAIWRPVSHTLRLDLTGSGKAILIIDEDKIDTEGNSLAERVEVTGETEIYENRSYRLVVEALQGFAMSSYVWYQGDTVISRDYTTVKPSGTEFELLEYMDHVFFIEFDIKKLNINLTNGNFDYFGYVVYNGDTYYSQAETLSVNYNGNADFNIVSANQVYSIADITVNGVSLGEVFTDELTEYAFTLSKITEDVDLAVTYSTRKYSVNFNIVGEGEVCLTDFYDSSVEEPFSGSDVYLYDSELFFKVKGAYAGMVISYLRINGVVADLYTGSGSAVRFYDRKVNDVIYPVDMTFIDGEYYYSYGEADYDAHTYLYAQRSDNFNTVIFEKNIVYGETLYTRVSDDIFDELENYLYPALDVGSRDLSDTSIVRDTRLTEMSIFIKVSGDLNINIKFEDISYVVTAEASSSGTVTITNASPAYMGASDLVATPNPGYYVAGYYINDVYNVVNSIVKGESYHLPLSNVTEDKHVEFDFAKITYRLVAFNTDIAAGDIFVGEQKLNPSLSYAYDYHAHTEMVFTVADGKRIIAITVNGTGVDVHYNMTSYTLVIVDVTEDYIVRLTCDDAENAVATGSVYTVSFTMAGAATASSRYVTAAINQNNDVYVVADFGYVLNTIVVGDKDSSATYVVPVNVNGEESVAFNIPANTFAANARVEIVVTTSPKQYILTTQAIGGHGTVSPGAEPSYGESVELDVTADSNCYISKVELNGEQLSFDSSYWSGLSSDPATGNYNHGVFSYVVDRNVDLKVYFAVNTYKVSVDSSSVNGDTVLSVGNNQVTFVEHGAYLNISMVAENGYHVSELYINGTKVMDIDFGTDNENDRRTVAYTYRGAYVSGSYTGITGRINVKVVYDINRYSFVFNLVNASANFSSDAGAGTLTSSYILNGNVYSGIEHGSNFSFDVTPTVSNGYYLYSIYIEYTSATLGENQAYKDYTSGYFSTRGGTIWFNDFVSDNDGVVADITGITVTFRRNLYQITLSQESAADTGAMNINFTHPNAIVSYVTIFAGEQSEENAYYYRDGVFYKKNGSGNLEEVDIALRNVEGTYKFMDGDDNVYDMYIEHGIRYVANVRPTLGYERIKFTVNGEDNNSLVNNDNNYSANLFRNVVIVVKYRILTYDITFSASVVDKNLSGVIAPALTAQYMRVEVKVVSGLVYDNNYDAHDPEETYAIVNYNAGRLSLYSDYGVKLGYGARVQFIMTPNFNGLETIAAKGYYLYSFAMGDNDISESSLFGDRFVSIKYGGINVDEGLMVREDLAARCSFRIMRYSVTTRITYLEGSILGESVNSLVEENGGTVAWGDSAYVKVTVGTGYNLDNIKVKRGDNAAVTVNLTNSADNDAYDEQMYYNKRNQNSNEIRDFLLVKNVTADTVVTAGLKREEFEIRYNFNNYKLLDSIDTYYNEQTGYPSINEEDDQTHGNWINNNPAAIANTLVLNTKYYDELRVVITPRNGYKIDDVIAVVRAVAYNENTGLWEAVLDNAGNEIVTNLDMTALSNDAKSFTFHKETSLLADLYVMYDLEVSFTLSIKTYNVRTSITRVDGANNNNNETGITMAVYNQYNEELGLSNSDREHTLDIMEVEHHGKIAYYGITATEGFVLTKVIVNGYVWSDFTNSGFVDNKMSIVIGKSGACYTYSITLRVNDELIAGHNYVSIGNIDVSLEFTPITYNIRAYINGVYYETAIIGNRNGATDDMTLAVYMPLSVRHYSTFGINPALLEGYEITKLEVYTGEDVDLAAKRCSELFERYIIGYDDTRVNMIYDDCNPFGMIAGDFGELTSLSKHTAQAASASTISDFNAIGTLFDAFMDGYSIPTDGTEYIVAECVANPSTPVSNNYASFYLRATGAYNNTLVSVGEISNNARRSAVIGANYPYSFYYGTDVSLSPTVIDYQLLAANLFGFSSKTDFMDYAQDLADVYASYRSGLINETSVNAALGNGCFYTDNHNFIFPIVVKNEMFAPVYAYVIIDTDGRVSIWLNDITAALWATNYNANYHTGKTLNNQFFCKNVLFVTGRDMTNTNYNSLLSPAGSNKSLSATFDYLPGIDVINDKMTIHIFYETKILNYTADIQSYVHTLDSSFGLSGSEGLVGMDSDAGTVNVTVIKYNGPDTVTSVATYSKLNPTDSVPSYPYFSTIRVSAFAKNGYVLYDIVEINNGIATSIVDGVRGVQYEEPTTDFEGTTTYTFLYQVNSLEDRTFRVIFKQRTQITVHVPNPYKYVSTVQGNNYYQAYVGLTVRENGAEVARVSNPNNEDILSTYVYNVLVGNYVSFEYNDITRTSTGNQVGADFMVQREKQSGGVEYIDAGLTLNPAYPNGKGKFITTATELYLFSHVYNRVTFTKETYGAIQSNVGGIVYFNNSGSEPANGFLYTGATTVNSVLEITASPNANYVFSNMYVRQIDRERSEQLGYVVYKTGGSEWLRYTTDNDFAGQDSNNFDIKKTVDSNGNTTFTVTMSYCMELRFEFYRVYKLQYALEYANEGSNSIEYCYPNKTSQDIAISDVVRNDYAKTTDEEDKFIYVQYGSSFTLEAPAAPENYVFVGWYVNNNNTYEYLDTILPTSDYVLRSFDVREGDLNGIIVNSYESTVLDIIAIYQPVITVTVFNELYYYDDSINHWNSWVAGGVRSEYFDFNGYSVPTVTSTDMLVVTESSTLSDLYGEMVYNSNLSYYQAFKDMNAYSISGSNRLYTSSSQFATLYQYIGDGDYVGNSWQNGYITFAMESMPSTIKLLGWQYYNWNTNTYEDIPYEYEDRSYGTDAYGNYTTVDNTFTEYTFDLNYLYNGVALDEYDNEIFGMPYALSPSSQYNDVGGGRLIIRPKLWKLIRVELTQMAYLQKLGSGETLDDFGNIIHPRIADVQGSDVYYALSDDEMVGEFDYGAKINIVYYNALTQDAKGNTVVLNYLVSESNSVPEERYRFIGWQLNWTYNNVSAYRLLADTIPGADAEDPNGLNGVDIDLVYAFGEEPPNEAMEYRAVFMKQYRQSIYSYNIAGSTENYDAAVGRGFVAVEDAPCVTVAPVVESKDFETYNPVTGVHGSQTLNYNTDIYDSGETGKNVVSYADAGSSYIISFDNTRVANATNIDSSDENLHGPLGYDPDFDKPYASFRTYLDNGVEVHSDVESAGGTISNITGWNTFDYQYVSTITLVFYNMMYNSGVTLPAGFVDYLTNGFKTVMTVWDVSEEYGDGTTDPDGTVVIKTQLINLNGRDLSGLFNYSLNGFTDGNGIGAEKGVFYYTNPNHTENNYTQNNNGTLFDPTVNAYRRYIRIDYNDGYIKGGSLLFGDKNYVNPETGLPDPYNPLNTGIGTSGEEDDYGPYKIYTLTQFQNLGRYFIANDYSCVDGITNEKVNFKLFADLKLQSKVPNAPVANPADTPYGNAWVPLTYYYDGQMHRGFNGILDGNDHVLYGFAVDDSNLTPTNDEENPLANFDYANLAGYGIFGVVNGGTIRNLKIANAYIDLQTFTKIGVSTEAKYIGVLTARAYNATFENITFDEGSYTGGKTTNGDKQGYSGSRIYIRANNADGVGLLAGYFEQSNVDNVLIDISDTNGYNINMSAANSSSSVGTLIGFATGKNGNRDDPTSYISNVTITGRSSSALVINYVESNPTYVSGGVVGQAEKGVYISNVKIYSTYTDPLVSYPNSSINMFIGSAGANSVGGIVGRLIGSVLVNSTVSSGNQTTWDSDTAGGVYLTTSPVSTDGAGGAGGQVGYAQNSKVTSDYTRLSITGLFFYSSPISGGIVGTAKGTLVQGINVYAPNVTLAGNNANNEVVNYYAGARLMMPIIWNENDYGGIVGRSTGGSIIDDCSIIGSGSTSESTTYTDIGASIIYVYRRDGTETSYRNIVAPGSSYSSMKKSTQLGNKLYVGGIAGYNDSAVYNSFTRYARLTIKYENGAAQQTDYHWAVHLGGIVGYLNVVNSDSTFYGWMDLVDSQYNDANRYQGQAMTRVQSCYADHSSLVFVGYIWCEGFKVNSAKTKMHKVAATVAGIVGATSDDTPYGSYAISSCYTYHNFFARQMSAYGYDNESESAGDASTGWYYHKSTLGTKYLEPNRVGFDVDGGIFGIVSGTHLNDPEKQYYGGAANYCWCKGNTISVNSWNTYESVVDGFSDDSLFGDVKGNGYHERGMTFTRNGVAATNDPRPNDVGGRYPTKQNASFFASDYLVSYSSQTPETNSTYYVQTATGSVQPSGSSIDILFTGGFVGIYGAQDGRICKTNINNGMLLFGHVAVDGSVDDPGAGAYDWYKLDSSERGYTRLKTGYLAYKLSVANNPNDYLVRGQDSAISA